MSIQISIDNLKWGTDPIPGVEDARRINLRDEESGIIVTFVFGGDPLEKLIMELSEALTDEQCRRVGAALLGGRMGDTPLPLDDTNGTN